MRLAGLRGYRGYGMAPRRHALARTRMSPESCRKAEAETLLQELCRPASQALDPLCDWRVRREQASEVHTEQRLNDEQVRSRGRSLHRQTAGISVELRQGASQGVRIAGEVR